MNLEDGFEKIQNFFNEETDTLDLIYSKVSSPLLSREFLSGCQVEKFKLSDKAIIRPLGEGKLELDFFEKVSINKLRNYFQNLSKSIDLEDKENNKVLLRLRFPESSIEKLNRIKIAIEPAEIQFRKNRERLIKEIKSLGFNKEDFNILKKKIDDLSSKISLKIKSFYKS